MNSAVIRRALARVLFVVAEGGPRHRALNDLRLWSRRYEAFKATRTKAVTGILLSKRAEVGATRPWDLGAGATYLRRRSGRRCADVAAWALAVEKTFGRRGIRISHALWASVLGCSQRSAGDAVRTAVEHGYLERQPWFRAKPSDSDATCKHFQSECVYVVTDQFRTFSESLKNRGFARRLLVGKICQLPEGQITTLSKKVSPNRMGLTVPDPARPLPRLEHRPAHSAEAGRASDQTRRTPMPCLTRPSLPNQDGLDPEILRWSSRAFRALEQKLTTDATKGL